ncbi:MAG: lytic transglycosylase domain-containing protein [Nocardioidaceae bacterium]
MARSGRGEILHNAGVGVVAMLPAAAVALLWGSTGFSDTVVPAAAVPAPFPGEAVSSSPVPAPAGTTGDAIVTITAPRNAVDPVDLSDAGLQRTQAAGDIPDVALAAYHRAATVINATDESCNLPWELLAALGRIESNHGRFGGSSLDAEGVATPPILGPRLDGTHNTSRIEDTDAGDFDGDTTFDRAVGPMQFIPSTWSYVGVDADGDGERNPQDIQDAALGAAVYLCVGKEDLATEDGQRRAVFRYNHSESYVDLALEIEHAYASGSMWQVTGGTSPTTPITVINTGSHDSDQTDPPRLPQAEQLASLVVLAPVPPPPPWDTDPPPTPTPTPTDPGDPSGSPADAPSPTSSADPSTSPDPSGTASTDPSASGDASSEPSSSEPSSSEPSSPEPSSPEPSSPEPDPVPADPEPVDPGAFDPGPVDDAAVAALPADTVDEATTLCQGLGLTDAGPLQQCVWAAVQPITVDHTAALPTSAELRARLEDVGIALP